MERHQLDQWVTDYFAAWQSNDAGAVRQLFAKDATYSTGPFTEPARGLEAIVAEWTGGGAPDDLEHRHNVIAVDGNVGVARWSARETRAATIVEMDGVLVLHFDDEGRCTEHLEWLIIRPT